MKKNYTKKLIMIACLFLSASFYAQLSGVYTINNALATGGTNFQTFTAFSASLNSVGVSGPVVVNVNPTNAYNEQVAFNQITGMSSTNSITINGSGATITFNATNAAAPHTFMLSGMDYMFVNNLNIIGTNITNGLVLHLWNNSDYNTFTNCNITGNITGTGTLLCPLSISGTASSHTGIGPAGSYNTFDGCNVVGGYSYAISFYGPTTTPYSTNNTFKNGSLKDFYQFGFFNYYQVNTTIKGNVIENVNRTTVGTRYPIYLSTNTNGCTIDGNHIRRLFQNMPPGSTSGLYCMYIVSAALQASPNIIQNNIISDQVSNGVIYGIYCPGYAYNHFYHNTIVLDDQTSTYTGTLYGLYASLATNDVKNNIMVVGRGGTGTKYAYYNGTANTIPSANNVVHITSSAGLNYAYYRSANFLTLGALQTAQQFAEPGSQQADPMFANPGLMDYTPTSLQINNMCPFIGVTTDQIGFTRSIATPDPGALEFYTIPCTGSAPANAVSTPTGVLCPNTNVMVTLANTFTNTGYSVQWYASTGTILGPYLAVSGATLPYYNTNTLTTTVYLNAQIACANGGGTVTATAGSVQIALPIVDNVTYTEGFEGISKTNQLPNCSWSASSNFTSTLTYTANGTGNRFPRTGTKFASFLNAPAGSKYFYSSGINLYPGITYSASLWYINEATGFNPWADLSIMVGMSQTPGAMVPIVTTTPAALVYTMLANTFTVPTAGVYFIGVRATTAAGSSPYLSWDDLKVNIPCELNAPPLAINFIASTICAGQPLAMLASGASSYTWSTGAQSAQVVVTPSINAVYSVAGTNSVSGCVATLVQSVTVLPSPPVAVFASKPVICEGESTNLYAQNANTYNWSTGVSGQVITVTPTTSTTYSVIGVNLLGCPTLQTILIAVNNKPTVSATASSTMLCKGDMVTLIGNGAATYQWSSAASLVQFGNPLNFVVQSSGGYTVTGNDANGCAGTALFVLSVEECTGINEVSLNQNDISAYPNPNNGMFYVESKVAGVKTLDIYDVTGRNVYAGTLTHSAKVNISEMPNGVYTVKVKAGEAVKYIKIVKVQ
jgi:hypothetical protein